MHAMASVLPAALAAAEMRAQLKGAEFGHCASDQS